MKHTIHGTATGGRFSNAEDVHRALMALDGCEVTVTIGRRHRRRTSGQQDEQTNFNGYLWGTLYKAIGDHLGYFTDEEMDQLHHWVQLAVGNVRVMPDGAKVAAGTRHMSGGEFAEYCSKVRMWASQYLGLYLPEPNEG